MAFFNQFTYRRHAKNHLPKGERIHECHICNKRSENFPCISWVIRWLLLYRYADPKILKCHIRGVHESKTEYQCHICSKVLKTKGTIFTIGGWYFIISRSTLWYFFFILSTGSLKAHLQATHAKSADFPCTEPGCTVKCRSKDLLRTHRQTHDPSKFECPICFQMFKRQSILTKHVRYTHTHANIRPHKCSTCGRDFKRANDLKLHISSVHGPSDQFR